ncbi:hypothetical protein OROMI_031580 [Orobanche minor]
MISWKDLNVVKTFLETCILEVGLNEKEGSSLKAHSWKKVSEIPKSTHNFDADRKQMRNHFDYLKGKFGAWLKLKNRTGNVYDPSTNTFNLTSEEWKLEIESNKYAESLRSTPLPRPELCAQLFEGGVCTGIAGHGPTSKRPLPTKELFVVKDEETPIASEQAPAKKKSKKGCEVSSDLDDKLKMVLESMALKQATPGPETITYEACLKRLNELGWEKGHPLFRIAYSLLTDVQNREAWMTLPAEFAMDWVKIVGAKQGYK